MAKKSNQKQRLLLLRQYLLEETDEQHPVSLKTIQDWLGRNDIPADRKTLYDDFELLNQLGMEIIPQGDGRARKYYAGTRDFELPEVRLLADSVLSSKFIPEEKSLALIGKLGKLTSRYEAASLKKQIHVAGRVKAENKSVFLTVDALQEGIAQNRRVKFHYFKYDVQREQVLRREGNFYEVSPFALVWDSENYYLVGFDALYQNIRHYRVDRMRDVTVLPLPREGQEDFEQVDISRYSRKVFSMFSGEETEVRLRFENDLSSVVLDQFGMDAMLIPDGPEHFTVSAPVVVSGPFYAWLMTFGDKVIILSPAPVAEAYREKLRAVLEKYS